MKKRRAVKHGRTYFGRRVRIKMQDGTEYIDRFRERRSKYFVLDDHGRVPVRDVQSMSIYQAPGKAQEAQTDG